VSRVTQLIKNPRIKKLRKSRRGLKLEGNPQRKAICLKALTISPKKPNSANRRVVKVKMLKSSTNFTVKITGEKHNLQQHSTILVRGGRCRDLIGVHLKAVRGKYDLAGVVGRKTSRSVYGVSRH
jgi:small subunit ribosomal protein S12